jgi:excisionase family DNA binding protein
MSDRLLVPREVFERLRLRPWAGYALLASGVIPVVRLGGRSIRVRESALNSWIAEGGSTSRPNREPRSPEESEPQ